MGTETDMVKREITGIQMRGRVSLPTARDLYRLVEVSKEPYGILEIPFDTTVSWGDTRPGYKPRPIWLRVKLSGGVELVLRDIAVMRGGSACNSWEEPLDPNGVITEAMRALLRQAVQDF